MNLLSSLRELESKGYVRSVQHVTLPLIVWNYTQMVMFDKLWGDYPILRQCRGLITDLSGDIIARGFAKFYNFEEHQLSELPTNEKIEVTEKMDGSLLIVFRYNDQVVYCTRGSFYSDQSIAGGKLFRELYDESMIEDGKTYLFEYISPENRIVVSYEKPELIHLAVLDSATGFDLPRDSRFKCVEVHTISGTFLSPELCAELKRLNVSNREGFVIRAIPNGDYPDWRCKIKFEHYCQLHRIVTGVSNKTIWEMLRDGKPFEDMLELCPDEFFAWLNKTKNDLLAAYGEIELRANDAYDCTKELTTRKDQAMFLVSNYKELSSVVFKMLDGSDYSGSIWNMIKPDRFIQPFANQSKANQ